MIYVATGIFRNMLYVTIDINSETIDMFDHLCFIHVITESDNRTNRLGRLMAMSFFGQFLGSFILAVMIKFTLVRNIFIFAAVICGLSIVVIITLLQDSLSDKATSAGKTSVIVCKSIIQ